MKKWYEVEFYGVEADGYEFSSSDCNVYAESEAKAIEYAKEYISELKDATEIVGAKVADYVFDDCIFADQLYIYEEEKYSRL